MNEYGTPLHTATVNGHSDVIRSLLSAGIQLSVIPIDGPYSGQRAYDVATTDAIRDTYHTYLFEKIASDDLESTINLLAGGLSPNLTIDNNNNNNNSSSSGGGSGETALHWAVNFNNYDISSALLDCGASVNSVNTNNGQTPFHYACKNNDTNIASLLLRHGADTTIIDSHGKLPLDLLTNNDKDVIADMVKNNPHIAKAINSSSSGSGGSGDGDDDIDDSYEYSDTTSNTHIPHPDDDDTTTTLLPPKLVVWPPVQVQTRLIGKLLVVVYYNCD